MWSVTYQSAPRCYFCFQDGEENLKGSDEENGLSSDYTPSPSDEEYEHTLDCGPSSHKPEGRDHLHDSKEESQEPEAAENTPEAPSETKAAEPPTEEQVEELPPMVPHPVPKPRLSRQTSPSSPSPPIAKPRTLHLTNPATPEKPSPPGPKKADPDSRPKQSLRKLKLTDEEKTQLVNLQSFSADSDSETPGGSSSCSSSSANAGGPPKPEGLDGQEEEGYWSGSTASHFREKRNRRCFKRKEMPSGQTRVRSKFSPWNLSSPRISRDPRLSVLVNHPGRVGELKTVQRTRKTPLSGSIVMLVTFFAAETTFRHTHSASEEGADGDDDDDDDDDEFEQDDMDLFDEKVKIVFILCPASGLQCM